MRKGTQLLDCFVCPSMIGKFTREGTGEMTCKEMFIYGCTTLDQTTKSMFHSSNYQEDRRVRFHKMLVENAELEATTREEVDGIAVSDTVAFNLLFKVEEAISGVGEEE